MKIKLLLLFALILSFKSYSQIVFEKGYFIDNNDKKTNCLIKNIDWSNNPSEIQYKLDEQDQPITISIQQIKSFEIENQSKYERFTVDIDKSTSVISNMSYDKNPEFKKETVLLKVLLEGKASLYEYVFGNTTRYFFKTDSVEINQLVFKSYKTSEEQIAQNKQYKQQLWMALKCDNIVIADVEKLTYRKNSLLKFFTKYNECNNSKYTIFKSNEKRDLFNLNIRPGITSSVISISNPSMSTPDYDRDFDNKIGFRFGVEAELFLPFNKNKWAVIFEPTYVGGYKAEKSRLDSRTNEELKGNIQYNAIELPLGIRYYMFLNNDSSVFLNGQIVMDQAINSEAYLEYSSQRNTTLELKPTTSFAFGLGYKFKQKYSVEFRANLGKNVVANYREWNSNYKSFALTFGYSIF
ncbi:porin family protein [Flavobacterium ustbae]|uniref:tRNA modification GTPase n=1 Tax=Flavobacterium ustbae TaxID=2488790 RepID=UPI000F78CC09|nr:tRNA modification GTPase [Flavobacterium ustbae]